MARERKLEVRGIPPGTAFMGTIGSLHGLWWRDEGGVYAIDVRDTDGNRVPYARKSSHGSFFGHSVRMDTTVSNFSGPVDVQIRVKGFSPWRGNNRNTSPSHIEVKYVREPDMRKGPRALRFTDID